MQEGYALSAGELACCVRTGKRDELRDQAAIRELERADRRHRRVDARARKDGSRSAPRECQLHSSPNGRRNHDTVSKRTSCRIQAITRSRPSHVFRFVNTTGLTWRIAAASRAMTDRSAPT